MPSIEHRFPIKIWLSANLKNEFIFSQKHVGCEFFLLAKIHCCVCVVKELTVGKDEFALSDGVLWQEAECSKKDRDFSSIAINLTPQSCNVMLSTADDNLNNCLVLLPFNNLFGCVYCSSGYGHQLFLFFYTSVAAIMFFILTSVPTSMLFYLRFIFCTKLSILFYSLSYLSDEKVCHHYNYSLGESPFIYTSS